MPKIIFKCSYLKNSPKGHLENLIKYIATRDGVEKVDDTKKLLPATEFQKKIINGIVETNPKVKNLSEYKNYINNSTRENASIFIEQALENNINLMLTKKNFIQYIAKRPRAERMGVHGLFTDDKIPIILSKVADEVANHEGNVWTHIISLTREDAQRLGYDSAKSWINLIRSQRNMIAENMKILPSNLKWYAAFHNESHHPHVHLVAYSINPKEGYVTKYGIENMKKTFAKEIFKQDLIQIYKHKDENRMSLKREIKNTISKIELGECENREIEKLMVLLSEKLKNTKGKKVYGYLKSDVKDIIDSIFEEISKEKNISKLYLQWCEYQNEIMNVYKDSTNYKIPISKQKEFKFIKNMIIQEVLNLSKSKIEFEEHKKYTELSIPKEVTDKKLCDSFLLPKNLNEEQKKIYSKFLVDNKDYYKEPSILVSVIKLVHHILKTLLNEPEPKIANVQLKIDRKLLKKLKQKKISQGHKEDESIQQIN